MLSHGLNIVLPYKCFTGSDEVCIYAICILVIATYPFSTHREHFITVPLLWTWWRLKSPASQWFTQPFFSGAGQRKHWQLRVTDVCEGNSPVTGEFPAQRTSNAENVSIWWRHHLVNSCVHSPFIIPSNISRVAGRCDLHLIHPSWQSTVRMQGQNYNKTKQKTKQKTNKKQTNKKQTINSELIIAYITNSTKWNIYRGFADLGLLIYHIHLT